MRRVWKIITLALLAMLWGRESSALAQQQRVLGIDVSTYQGNLSETTWATFKRPIEEGGDSRDFVLIRASRGGTTGEDHRQGGYTSGNNTYYTNSQRYDDRYFVQNITLATAAGLFAGPYHFGRADVIATTLNTGGIANTGTDEANHMIQMAGAWMRPGYILPVFDLEGPNPRTTTDLAAFCIEFADRIYGVMGIRPIMYINGGYCTTLQSYSNPSALVTAFPRVWIARYTSNTNAASTEYLTGNPKDSFGGFYGPWDDAPNPAHPWSFWQYNSNTGLNGYGGSIDKNVANGGMEFLKDHLVPALWMDDVDGNWTTLAKWNSGQTPIPPATGTGQLTPIGTQTLPTPRLPTSNDTVIVDRLDVTVSLTSGAHEIRKLYIRNTLNITGGALGINYVPSPDSTPISAQFSGPVTLTGSGSLSVHTLQVDAGQTFTLGGGILSFNTINLIPDSFSTAKIAISGNVNLNSWSNVTATISNGAGSGNSGQIDLGGTNRTLTIGNGTNDVDLSIEVPITNGALTKAGAGTLRVTSANTYASGTTVSAGTLLVNNIIGSGTGSGSVAVNSGTIGGTGTIGGALNLASAGTISPGDMSAIGTLTLSSSPTLNGTNFMEINRNGGSSLADKLVLSSGTLNYGGTLVISNVGATLVGGEVFTNFAASNYTGAFTTMNLPTLSSGLNWYTSMLNTNGTIKVNRSPVANAVTVTNIYPSVLKIPRSSLTGTDADADALTLANFGPATTNGVTVMADTTYLIYSNNVNVADKFIFTLSDGHGGTATNTVRIVPSATGEFAGRPSITNNAVTLRFAGNPGSTYFLQRSTNLPAWLTISTNMVPSNGLFNYTDDFHDLNAPPSSAFYRLKTP